MSDKKPNLTQADIKRMQDEFGVDDLYIDSFGNICETIGNQIVAAYKSPEVVQNAEKADCKKYFSKLPSAVQDALLKESLAHLIKQSSKQMGRYDIKSKDSELWGLSYEELAKITAEGILLNGK